jgi:NAD(P)-dependent dehydrogenase (short-subunit alcohol dehydrogenase family)
MSKVVVVTGAGGVLCSTLAKALAKEGHKIAVLDLRIDAANKVAEEINSEGGTAIAVANNVLEKTSLDAAKLAVNNNLGACDIFGEWCWRKPPLRNNLQPTFIRRRFVKQYRRV